MLRSRGQLPLCQQQYSVITRSSCTLQLSQLMPVESHPDSNLNNVYTDNTILFVSDYGDLEANSV